MNIGDVPPEESAPIIPASPESPYAVLRQRNFRLYLIGRFIASLDSVSSFSNFDFLYFDMRKRLNWGFRVFDDRSFYTTYDFQNDTLDRRQAYRQTGALGILSYPFSRYHRVDVGTGYMMRDAVFPQPAQVDGQTVYFLTQRRDTFPIVSSTFTGDTTVFKSFGPISGRRYQVTGSYAPDTKDGGTLSGDVQMDWRGY